MQKTFHTVSLLQAETGARPKNGVSATQSTLRSIHLCWCTRRTPYLSSAPLCAAVWSQQDNINSHAAFFASGPSSRRRCQLGSPCGPSLLCLFQAHWQLLTSHTITRHAPRLLLERFFPSSVAFRDQRHASAIPSPRWSSCGEKLGARPKCKNGEKKRKKPL